MRVVAQTAAAFLVVIASVIPAMAQQRQRLPIAAADLRFFYAGLGQDPITAADLSLQVEDLPSRGLGGVAGFHLYVLRGESMALGIGGEALIARGRRQAKDATTGDPIGFPVEQRLISLSPQLSLNFGHRQGWSYVSAGLGPVSFETFKTEFAPHDLPPKQTTMNFGGGARWFMTPHVAFSFDVRFYRTKAIAGEEPFPGRQAARLLVMSAGMSFK